MAVRGRSVLGVVLIASLVCTIHNASLTEALSGKKLRQSLGKRAEKRGNILNLKGDDLVTIVKDNNRRFDVVIFVSSAEHEKKSKGVMDTRLQYETLAASYATNTKDDPEKADALLFSEIKYSPKTSQLLTGLRFVSVPAGGVLTKDVRMSKNGTVTGFGDDHKVAAGFNFKAEAWKSMLEGKYGHSIGNIRHPSIFDHWYAYPALVLCIGVNAFIGWKVLHAEFIRKPLIWGLGSAFIGIFSMSGFFKVIIRKGRWKHPGTIVAKTSQEHSFVECSYIFSIMLVMTVCIVGISMGIRHISDLKRRHVVSYLLMALLIYSLLSYINTIRYKVGVRYRFVF